MKTMIFLIFEVYTTYTYVGVTRTDWYEEFQTEQTDENTMSEASIFAKADTFYIRHFTCINLSLLL